MAVDKNFSRAASASNSLLSPWDIGDVRFTPKSVMRSLLLPQKKKPPDKESKRLLVNSQTLRWTVGSGAPTRGFVRSAPRARQSR